MANSLLFIVPSACFCAESLRVAKSRIKKKKRRERHKLWLSADQAAWRTAYRRATVTERPAGVVHISDISIFSFMETLVGVFREKKAVNRLC